jgi:hypothetical protein
MSKKNCQRALWIMKTYYVLHRQLDNLESPRYKSGLLKKVMCSIIATQICNVIEKADFATAKYLQVWFRMFSTMHLRIVNHILHKYMASFLWWKVTMRLKKARVGITHSKLVNRGALEIIWREESWVSTEASYSPPTKQSCSKEGF